MGTISSGRPASVRQVRLGVLALGILLTCVSSGIAQMSPEEHAKHHPAPDKEKDIHTANYKSYHITSPNNYNVQFSAKISAGMITGPGA